MAQLIDKDAAVEEIKKRLKEAESHCGGYKSYDEHRCDNCTVEFYEEFLEILDTLEAKDPYEQCVQYDSIKAGIQSHAETYSFNIESKLFNQLTKEQQELWRKEIEQACISGSEVGVELARDPRYKENLEVKDTDSEKEIYETAEAFAKIIRANLTGIDKDVQYQFEQLYKQITGERMYQGYTD